MYSKASERTQPLHRYLPGLYPIGLILLFSPIADVLTRVIPLRAWDVGWRFGALGMSFDSMVTSLLGLAVILTIAVVLDHKRVRIVVGYLALVGAVSTLTALGLFSLDYLQLRASVEARALKPFDVAALKALLEAVLAMIALAFLGRRAVTANEAEDRDPLILHSEKEAVI